MSDNNSVCQVYPHLTPCFCLGQETTCEMHEIRPSGVYVSTPVSDAFSENKIRRTETFLNLAWNCETSRDELRTGMSHRVFLENGFAPPPLRATCCIAAAYRSSSTMLCAHLSSTTRVPCSVWRHSRPYCGSATRETGLRPLLF